MEFSSKGVYDATRNRITYWGHGHIAAEKVIIYDEVGNNWSIYTGPNTGQTFAHPYYHWTLNEVAGDHYLHSYSGATIYKLTNGATTFTTVTGTTNYANQATFGFEWFPQLNGGAGGLVFSEMFSIQTSDAAITTWTPRTTTNTQIMGQYHIASALAKTSGIVYSGGGNGSNRMWKTLSTGATSEIAQAPINPGIYVNGQACLVPHPNGVDLLLFGCPSQSSAIYRYNAASDTWTSVGSHSLGNGEIMAVTASRYSGVVLIMQTTAFATPTCTLYKV